MSRRYTSSSQQPLAFQHHLFRNIIKKSPSALCHLARRIPSICLLARARGKDLVHAFVSRKRLSVPLLTPWTTRRRRKNPGNIREQEKCRLARSYQHKASLMEEELRHENTVFPDSPLPAPPPPATQDWPPMDNHYPTPPPAPRKDQTLLS
jgi:hypothetical protein